MNINRIREFLLLSEHLNYSKTANLLYITQPALTRHIRELEEVFGEPLFQRNTHNVELTEFGKLCVSELKVALTAYDSAMLRISSASGTANESLTVGFLDYAVRPFLNQFAAWFEDAHPNIDIDYISGNSDDLTESILEDKLDLAYIPYSDYVFENNKDLESKLILEDRILAVCNPAHAISGMKSVSLTELSVQPLILFYKNNYSYPAKFHRKLFEDKNLPINIVKEVSSLESGIFYAKAGIGIFLIPQHLSPLANDLTTIPISDEDCMIPLNLVWSKHNPKKSLQTYIQDFWIFYQTK